MRKILPPLLALTIAAGATYGARVFLRQDGHPAPAAVAQPEPPPGKTVLVAAKDLQPGSFVQADSLRWQDWPDVQLPETYAVQGDASEADFVGSVVRRPMAPGEPVATSNLVKPGERGFLAAVLDPGMRAVSIPVDGSSGNAGLIFPGGDERRVSETVLEDVWVIAMGSRLSAPEGDDAGPSGSEARTATLEVTPRGPRRSPSSPSSASFP